ncbi:hypothetical protein D3OALGA1CA_4632 [Olavius algarvensis associated proteobacterium Delta 3]|nr:hypothetical protein D3OALGB2SA_4820 [Olavius algarvensis associated proteobacterium Delta 3]CAB5154465.1 hypothetical protein D3OALGA1CA_4632 [Olavius algarvensis associated proteobacterium Delta 3]
MSVFTAMQARLIAGSNPPALGRVCMAGIHQRLKRGEL